MKLTTVTPADIRRALLLREEIALLDLRHEAGFATGHPLFAANMAADRIAIEAELRLPRKDVPIVLYDDGEGLVAAGAERLAALGYTDVRAARWRAEGLARCGLSAVRGRQFLLQGLWRAGGVAPAHAVVQRRRSRKADRGKANIAILDVRRFDEYATMNIPGSVSVPGAELVLRAGQAAPDPDTTIIVNCAGRTRSIIGTQSLINAGVPNKVRALRNGTIGWTLARHTLDHGADRRGAIGPFEGGPANARDVAYRAGVRHIGASEMRMRSPRRPIARSIASTCATPRNMRPAISRASAIIPAASWSRRSTWPRPVRGARIVLTDDKGVRADMTASWLAQMGWEVYVLEGGYDGALEVGPPRVLPKPDPAHRYRRPYEGTDVAERAMQAYLDWEYGLVEQLASRRHARVLRDAAVVNATAPPSSPHIQTLLCCISPAVYELRRSCDLRRFHASPRPKP